MTIFISRIESDTEHFTYFIFSSRNLDFIELTINESSFVVSELIHRGRKVLIMKISFSPLKSNRKQFLIKEKLMKRISETISS